MTDLKSLLERVEQASGEPDWELDRDIGLTIGGWELKAVEGYEQHGIMLHTPDGVYVNAEGAPIPSFIESLDAAIALCERVLPGYSIQLDIADIEAIVQQPGCEEFRAYAVTPPLALLSALLRAIVNKDRT